MEESIAALTMRENLDPGRRYRQPACWPVGIVRSENGDSIVTHHAGQHAGRHSDSDDPPQFDGPILESQKTLAPGIMDFDRREGYGRNKVAPEQTLLDSGFPVTVLRPSKIHGEAARPPREWIFVERVLDHREVVLLPATLRHWSKQLRSNLA